MSSNIKEVTWTTEESTKHVAIKIFFQKNVIFLIYYALINIQKIWKNGFKIVYWQWL